MRWWQLFDYSICRGNKTLKWFWQQCLSVCKTLNDFNMIYVSMLRYKSRSQGISYKVEAKKKIAQSTFWPIFPSLQKMHKSTLSIFLLTKNIFYWIIRLHNSFFLLKMYYFSLLILKIQLLLFKFHLIRSLVLRKILQERYFTCVIFFRYFEFFLSNSNYTMNGRNKRKTAWWFSLWLENEETLLSLFKWLLFFRDSLALKFDGRKNTSQTVAKLCKTLSNN